ncbi:MAG TPA: efflux RND transporter periplasmic adaptor subunit [Vicinamibacterales bacterium]|jgi:cobalt-zinc-cadmium efflux system membrane fusion protein|nr:efflux RND transporter periplasmic adaptor subunit [Vicinamibacterales bacterium]
MKRTNVVYASSVLLCGLLLGGCSILRGQTNAQNAGAPVGAPPPPNVVPVTDASLFTVDHPEQFPLAAATAHSTSSELVVTGTVTPDVSRSVPVVSLASGRVMAIHARLGDTVQKGQLLLTIRSDDVAGGYANYRKALADEILARAQLARSQDLYNHGAIPQTALEIAQDTEDKAKVDVETTAEHLRLIGNNPDAPAAMVDIFAPASGVITDQQVTNASAVQAFSAPSPFTISDLSSVWVVCDVYENDLPNVRIGDTAAISLNAFPDRMFNGRVSNIGAVLDPNIRTAKVRIEIQNPGIMRLGMFVRATFRGQTNEMHTIVPASAVLHMHDRDFLYIPAPGNRFRRVEVISGDLLQDNVSQQEIKSGLAPGQQVVTNALVLDHVLAQ